MKRYEVNYILTTDKEMTDWLHDFQDWLESRGETIGGTIGPFVEQEPQPVLSEEDMKLFQELINRAIPKKPVREIWGWDCPSCGHYVAYYPLNLYRVHQGDVYVFLNTCPNYDCRQAIDWSE